MSTIYDYAKPGIESPDLDRLKTDIENSAMSNKSYEESWWNESDGILHVQFTTALNPADKAILDAIVAALPNLPIPERLYLDVREIPWSEWQPIPDDTAPIDAGMMQNDPGNLAPDVAIFNGLLTGGPDQHVECWALDYPPYQGDMERIGRRDYDPAGGDPNTGVYTHIGGPSGNRSTLVLVYLNNVAFGGQDWVIPPHTIKIDMGGVVRNAIIPRLVIPPASRRVLWVMSPNTVIGADSLMEPHGSENGLAAFPLRVVSGLGIWCPPRKFKYHDMMHHWETVAPSWWFQQNVNSICAARMGIECNMVTGVAGKGAKLFVRLNYGPLTIDDLVFVAEARVQKSDGATPLQQFSPLEAIASAFVTPIVIGGQPAALVTTPGASNQPFDCLFSLETLPGLTDLVPPSEIEFRLKRLGEDPQDTGETVDLLCGGLLVWFK